MLVPVAHFQREPYSTFGNPFLIKIKEGETYEEIKERIRAHLDVPEKDFEKYRYANRCPRQVLPTIKLAYTIVHCIRPAN